MNSFHQVRDQVQGAFQKAQSKADALAYYQLGVALENMIAILREHIQDKTKVALQAALKNLQSGKDITSEEMDLIKTWISGPADSYIRMENNFQDWLKDLERVLEGISQIQEDQLSVESALKLSGLAQDGRRTSVDVVNYLEKKEQVCTFENAVRNLSDAEKRAHLIMLLNAKLNSRDF